MYFILHGTKKTPTTTIATKTKQGRFFYLIYVLTEMSQSQLSVVGEGMARNSGVLSDQE